jgi:hypothetical protein
MRERWRLEWSDKVQTETAVASLILCEAELDRRRTFEAVPQRAAAHSRRPRLGLSDILLSQQHFVKEHERDMRRAKERRAGAR